MAPADALLALKSLAPLELPAALLDELAARYEQPPRAYHHIGHVAEVTSWFAKVRDAVGWQAPVEVYLALLYHDAVYVAGRSDNEAASAAWARAQVVRHLPDVAVDTARVARLIELTAQHGKLDPSALDRDAQLFLDCDMAILGSEASRFARYELEIAEEYAAVPAELYRAGRRAFLQRLRDSARIFHSDWAHRTLEWRARANLCRALGLADIVQDGAAVLRARAAEVDVAHIGSAEMQALFARMIDAMRAAPGVGLAAPQIGIGLRVFVVEDRAEYIERAPAEDRAARERTPVGPRAFVNPIVTPVGSRKVGFTEGCLSVAGRSGHVERWHEVEVKALDEHGQPQRWRVSGWPARILQHEMDHLNGTLYVDHCKPELA